MSDADQRLRALGHAIRAVRRECDLSQEAVAALSGVHVNQIGRLERGEANARLVTFLRVVDGLGVPLSEIGRRYEARLQADRR